MSDRRVLSALSVRKESLTDRAFDAIREAIVSRALPPGEILSERAVASQLEISKTPVREALLRLQHMGLVEQTGRGMRITPSSEQRMLDAYEVRAALESHTARTAAERGSDEELDAIVAASNATVRPRGPEPDHVRLFPGFYSPDLDFHMQIARAARNAHLERLVNEAFTMCWVLRQRDVEEIGFPNEFGKQHERIARSVHARDKEAAAREMLEHVLFVRETFVHHYRTT
ncbi:MAG: GntR family transcriptional regulator [Gaiellales bacterium]